MPIDAFASSTRSCAIIQETHGSKPHLHSARPFGRYCCKVARTQEALGKVAWLRGRSFGFEGDLGLLPRTATVIGREFGPLDTLPTTIHFLTEAGKEPAATARLLLPNLEVAREQETRHGLALEQLYQIVRGPGSGDLAAEISRLCVLRQFQGSKALLALFARILEECKAWGVSHLLGATNLESNSPEDATIAYRLACHQGLLSPLWRAEPRSRMAPVSSPPPSRYPLQQRLLALRGEFTGLKLPRTLMLLIKMVGARIIGEPVLDPYMGLFSIPIVVDLDAIPPATARLLARSWRRRGARRPSTSPGFPHRPVHPRSGDTQ